MAVGPLTKADVKPAKQRDFYPSEEDVSGVMLSLAQRGVLDELRQLVALALYEMFDGDRRDIKTAFIYMFFQDHYGGDKDKTMMSIFDDIERQNATDGDDSLNFRDALTNMFEVES